MKLAVKAVIFSFICIAIFGFIYKIMGHENFHNGRSDKITLIDYLFLATTIQSGVGFSDLYPNSDLAKLVIIIQQFIMISTNVFILYIFTTF